MRCQLFVLTLSLALVSLVVATGESSIDFKNPVRSASEDEIKSMPGLNYTLNFKQYSGYLEADDKQNRFWHYWFVESQSSPASDPIVLWLNGGPGCSSLLGLLTELGPFTINAEHDIIENKFAWNKHANIIFLESPAGVGFSYAVDGSVVANDDSTANQNHQALRSFFKKFPQFHGRPLYLTGESYGGVYLPTLASLVDQDSELNLKGVAIGNGYLDANLLSESLIFFSYHHGLVGQSVWRGLSHHCCQDKPPARGQCNFFSRDRSEQCKMNVYKAADAILNSGLNPYNLYDRCAQSGEAMHMIYGPQVDIAQLPRASRRSNDILPTRHVGREHFERSLIMNHFNISIDPNQPQSTSRQFSLHPELRGDPPCTDDSITITYLNRPDVKAALHIPAGLQKFTTCFDEIKYTMQYPARQGGLAPFIKKLIQSPRKLTLLVYNGDTDMMCNFLGDEWFVDELHSKVTQDYHTWKVNKQVAGFIKVFKGITYMTVKGSGHMVPTDRPAEALHMFENYLLKLQPSDYELIQ